MQLLHAMLQVQNLIFASSTWRAISHLIIKITISSIVIGFKNSYFPLIHLPSCYRTVCYWEERLRDEPKECLPGRLFVMGQFVIGQFNKPIRCSSLINHIQSGSLINQSQIVIVMINW